MAYQMSIFEHQLNFITNTVSGPRYICSAPPRYGAIITDGDQLPYFSEKPRGMGHSLMAVVFVLLSPNVFKLIEGDQTI